jgi:hypothetical protein
MISSYHLRNQSSPVSPINYNNKNNPNTYISGFSSPNNNNSTYNYNSNNKLVFI